MKNCACTNIRKPKYYYLFQFVDANKLIEKN
jgi:hypothetical protein